MTATGAPAPDSPAAGAPVIDSHQHFWDLSAHYQPWLVSDPVLAPLLRNFTLADLAPLAAAEGVTASVVVQTVTESWETPELLALAAGPGLVAGVVGWTDLTAPDIADVLAELRGLPGGDRLSGIRHPVLVEPDPDWLARPGRAARAESAGRHGPRLRRGRRAPPPAGRGDRRARDPRTPVRARSPGQPRHDPRHQPRSRRSRGQAPSPSSPPWRTPPPSCPASSASPHRSPPLRAPSRTSALTTISHCTLSARTGSCSAPTGRPAPWTPATPRSVPPRAPSPPT